MSSTVDFRDSLQLVRVMFRSESVVPFHSDVLSAILKLDRLASVAFSTDGLPVIDAVADDQY